MDDFAPVRLAPLDDAPPPRAAGVRPAPAEPAWLADAPPPGETTAARKVFIPTPYVWRAPETIPTRQWLYGRHYVCKFVSVTVAPPGVGKSSLALAEAIDMASGRGFIAGKRVTPARVWYVNLEDPRDEIERRVAAILLHHDIDSTELEDRLLFDSGREISLILGYAGKAGAQIDRATVEALIDAIAAAQIDVLIIDPFVAAHRVPENDNTAVETIVSTLAEIAERAECGIELVHHTRKSGGVEVTVEDGRGASALLGKARSARAINPMSEDEAARAGVYQPRRAFFRVDSGKSSMSPPADKAAWFRLVSVNLGNGGGGPDDEVGAVEPWEWPNAFDGLSLADLRKVQDRLAEGEHANDVRAGNWAGYAVAEALGIDADDAGAKARVKSLLAAWIKNRALKIERRRSGRDGRDRAFVVVGERA